MPYQAMQKFVLGDVWDFNPLPPANSAAMKKPEKVVDLSEKFAASYRVSRRIGMLRPAS